METNFNHRHFTFMTPSGHQVTIREQNGEDDDILSNPVEAASMMNLSRFISSIIVECNYFEGKKTITPQEAQILPALDRYCILFQSRKFSLGEVVEFVYDWGQDNGGKVEYSQEIDEFLFNYSSLPTEDEVKTKPNAIPFYPQGGQFKDLEFTTTYGNRFRFDLMNAKGEAYILELPLDQRTKNKELVARNLRMLVDDKWDRVTNFRMFSVKEMREIRAEIFGNDPVFYGITEIENPNVPGQKAEISIVALKDFFYPGEM